MLARNLLTLFLMLVIGLGAAECAAADSTSVALTLTKTQDEASGQLGDNLLSLVELRLQTDTAFAIVERREIDKIIQEQLLDRAQARDPQLQLGKLETADFLVMLELVPDQKGQKADKPLGRLRVVEAQTAAIRAVTAAVIDEATLEETADDFARYVRAVTGAPRQRLVTIAVTPFESKGRFDRLRPLELGVRDLVTTRLLELSGASAEPGNKQEAQAETQSPRFQVLQRSSMEQLQRELDLIRSGFSDQKGQPGKLPDRAAAYLIRGELDERQEDDRYSVIVRGEVVDATTLKVLEPFDLECSPGKLPAELGSRVDALAQRLWVDHKVAAPSHVPEGFEVASLKELVLADLSRFIRRVPSDFSYRRLLLPGHKQAATTAVKVPSALGRHLLSKSIDRLESILFISPDDAEAACALGFCYSMHQPGIYQPQRADELLRKVYSLDPESEISAIALLLLAELDYDNESGQLDANRDPAGTVERIWFAFEKMPEKYRDRHWPRLVELIGRLPPGSIGAKTLADLMTRAAPYAERAEEQHRDMLAMAVGGIATQLITTSKKDAPEAHKAKSLLARWAKGKDKLLADLARQDLATVAVMQGNPLGAAQAYKESAAKNRGPDRQSRYSHDSQIIKAATNYREAGLPEKALELLESLVVKEPLKDMSVEATRGLEVGLCYEALHESDKALAAYLKAASQSTYIVDNSDIVQRIIDLGGVPLRSDREVDVRYCRPAGKRQAAAAGAPRQIIFRTMASDGQKIFSADGDGLELFDPAAETGQPIAGAPPQITCMKTADGQLWVGTDSAGLWRYSLETGRWQEVAADHLPDRHVESLALADGEVYVGVGTRAAGGLARIDRDERVHLYDQPEAPTTAPHSIVVAEKALLVTTSKGVFEYSPSALHWTGGQVPAGPRAAVMHLFAGPARIWASAPGRELYPWDATREEIDRFKPTWYRGHKAGCKINFVSQRGDEIWFGGDQAEFFVSSGLYRFNPKNGAYYQFTPADGFTTTRLHPINGGMWLGDQLWLKVDSGLCRVTPRTALAPKEGTANQPVTSPSSP